MARLGQGSKRRKQTGREAENEQNSRRPDSASQEWREKKGRGRNFRSRLKNKGLLVGKSLKLNKRGLQLGKMRSSPTRGLRNRPSREIPDRGALKQALPAPAPPQPWTHCLALAAHTVARTRHTGKMKFEGVEGETRLGCLKKRYFSSY